MINYGLLPSLLLLPPPTNTHTQEEIGVKDQFSDGGRKREKGESDWSNLDLIASSS